MSETIKEPKMRVRFIVCALGIVVPAIARGQVTPSKAKQDSIARATASPAPIQSHS